MPRWLKRTLLILVTLILTMAGSVYALFQGMKPVEDGQVLAGFATVVKEGYVSAVILDAGNGRVALVDALQSPDGARLKAALAAKGLQPEAVEAIFLTHGHVDHVGGIGAFPKAKVYGLAGEIPLLEGKAASKGPLTRFFPAKDSGVRLTEAVADGQQLQVGNLSAQVYAIPGHTAGSAAWLINGVLFLGDSADMDAEGQLQPAKWVFTDDPTQNRTSLSTLATRLKAEGKTPQALWFAHSGATTDGAVFLTQGEALKP